MYCNFSVNLEIHWNEFILMLKRMISTSFTYKILNIRNLVHSSKWIRSWYLSLMWIKSATEIYFSLRYNNIILFVHLYLKEHNLLKIHFNKRILILRLHFYVASFILYSFISDLFSLVSCFLVIQLTHTVIHNNTQGYKMQPHYILLTM